MEEDLRDNIEKIFRESDNPDQLFDALNVAVRHKLRSSDTYKILLANPALSSDEICMFTEKLIKEFPEFKYELYMWVAELFENNSFDYYSIDKSLHYYAKALDSEPGNHEPLISALKLYNYEIKLPTNSAIIDLVDNYMDGVKEKKNVYYALVEHHKKTGDIESMRKYQALAERSQNGGH